MLKVKNCFSRPYFHWQSYLRGPVLKLLRGSQTSQVTAKELEIGFYTQDEIETFDYIFGDKYKSNPNVSETLKFVIFDYVKVELDDST